jgi:[protein-PII] uridylyltransferase
VGGHSVRAAALVRDGAAADPRAAAVLRVPADRRIATVAALLHDIGKRSDTDDHGLAGAPVAREAALQLGLSGPEAKAVSKLVRDHLLLAQTAAAADIDDEDVVTEVAARIGEARLVGPLYVLTMADSLATGADMWTPWKAALTGELAGKLERLLTGGEALTLAGQASAVRDEVLTLARFEQVPSSIADFARHAPLRYLAEHTPEEVVDHARLAFTLAQGSRSGTARLEVRGGPMPSTWRATVVALDRPGLLATLAGVFALSGLDILAVAAHTTGRGVALDTFVVAGATLAEVDSSVWAKVERSLSAALEGKLAVPVRLAERRSHYRATERRVSPKVRWDAGNDFTTAITVKAADRVGMLHDLALAIGDAGLDIRSVTAVTSDGVARDTFRVVDEYGQPPTDASTLDALGVTLDAVAGTL